MAGLGVVVGAFGAHALKEILLENHRADTFELAVRYQFYHAFALLINGLLMDRYFARLSRYASLCFTGGIILFSGSLYILCLTGITVFGAVTPFGGVLFILGWLFVLISIKKNRPHS